MARKRTIKASGINLRVHTKHAPEEYVALWRLLVRLKQHKLRGDTALMIGSSRALESGNPNSPLFGYLYRFLNINPDEPWFDIEQQKQADDDDVAQVRIPPKLKPNLEEIPYIFDVAKHRLYFQSGGTHGGVSPGMVHGLLEFLCSAPQVISRFGDVDKTIMTREGVIDELLAWPVIRQIRVVLDRPNPSEYEDDQAFYEMLERRNLRREEHVFYKAKDAPTITPDDEMVAMFGRAVTDGIYKQTGVNPEGKAEEASSEQYPRTEIGLYDPDVQMHSDAFIGLVKAKFK
ncbi:DUF4747 family protein [Ramlibacter sp. Leaf400]|uniref:DUF4747 family protein n=1 Tax=Ramlibacter sp. Leaf400 TaxID=1736365 RepID=UPI00070211F6|nr:DUF4747 family protein [Ramlibacter sp. Leaf400]KQT10996.1 hypothetical protein ASG30_09365 [Ramlibacter sp. Leaf400]